MSQLYREASHQEFTRPDVAHNRAVNVNPELVLAQSALDLVALVDDGGAAQRCQERFDFLQRWHLSLPPTLIDN